MPTQQNQVVLQGQLVGDPLVEALAVRGHVDNLVVGSFCLQGFYARYDGLNTHDHPRTAAVGVVVYLGVFPKSKGPEVVHMDGCHAFVHGAL